MQFALDNKGKRTRITQANYGESYYCACCDEPMIQRRGDIRIHHFAHQGSHHCADAWKYDPMTEWHLGWQERYPEECREVVIKRNGARHRADVLVNGTVIEFQHSSISYDDFMERNRYYTDAGYRVIWLFDARDQENLTEEKPCSYKWKHAPRNLRNFDFYSDVQIYLHMDGEQSGRIVRVCSGDFSEFRTYGKTKYDEDEFLRLTIEGISADTYSLYDTLHFLRRKNGENAYYGCPLNDDGFANVTEDNARISCDACQYCRGKYRYVVRCAGRYRDHEITVLLEQEKDRFTYLDHTGKICTGAAESPRSPAKSIIELARIYGAKIYGVRNLESGRKFKITGNAAMMCRNFHGIYGYMWDSRIRGYSNTNCKLYYANRPQWVMEWFYC